MNQDENENLFSLFPPIQIKSEPIDFDDVSTCAFTPNIFAGVKCPIDEDDSCDLQLQAQPDTHAVPGCPMTQPTTQIFQPNADEVAPSRTPQSTHQSTPRSNIKSTPKSNSTNELPRNGIPRRSIRTSRPSDEASGSRVESQLNESKKQKRTPKANITDTHTVGQKETPYKKSNVSRQIIVFRKQQQPNTQSVTKKANATKKSNATQKDKSKDESHTSYSRKLVQGKGKKNKYVDLEWHRRYQAEYRKKQKERLENLYKSPAASIVNCSTNSTAIADGSLNQSTQLDNSSSFNIANNQNPPESDVDFGPEVNVTKALVLNEFEKVGKYLKIVNNPDPNVTVGELMQTDKEAVNQVDLFTALFRKYIKERREVLSKATKLPK